MSGYQHTVAPVPVCFLPAEPLYMSQYGSYRQIEAVLYKFPSYQISDKTSHFQTCQRFWLSQRLCCLQSLHSGSLPDFAEPPAVDCTEPAFGSTAPDMEPLDCTWVVAEMLDYFENNKGSYMVLAYYYLPFFTYIVNP